MGLTLPHCEGAIQGTPTPSSSGSQQHIVSPNSQKQLTPTLSPDLMQQHPSGNYNPAQMRSPQMLPQNSPNFAGHGSQNVLTKSTDDIEQDFDWDSIL